MTVKYWKVVVLVLTFGALWGVMAAQLSKHFAGNPRHVTMSVCLLSFLGGRVFRTINARFVRDESRLQERRVRRYRSMTTANKKYMKTVTDLLETMLLIGHIPEEMLTNSEKMAWNLVVQAGLSGVPLAKKDGVTLAVLVVCEALHKPEIIALGLAHIKAENEKTQPEKIGLPKRDLGRYRDMARVFEVTWTKLADGSWGIRSELQLTPGTRTRVLRANGIRSWVKVGESVPNAGNGVYIYRKGEANALRHG